MGMLLIEARKGPTGSISRAKKKKKSYSGYYTYQLNCDGGWFVPNGWLHGAHGMAFHRSRGRVEPSSQSLAAKRGVIASCYMQQSKYRTPWPLLIVYFGLWQNQQQPFHGFSSRVVPAQIVLVNHKRQKKTAWGTGEHVHRIDGRVFVWVLKVFRETARQGPNTSLCRTLFVKMPSLSR